MKALAAVLAFALAMVLLAGCMMSEYDRQGINRDDRSPATDSPPSALPSHNSAP